jgi:5-methyltetrahydropteroyltriglutamate--homocysteine methyltransferase
MPIPTEPIGSIPRPPELIAAMREKQAGGISTGAFREVARRAQQDTIRRFEETGSPIITDGEQTKSSFVTYPLEGLSNIASDGIVLPFEDGHTRQLPRLTAGPFRYGTHAASFVASAIPLTRLPVKQAVISASALSLLYPENGIPGYSREAFLKDLLDEAELDSRKALAAGADTVQIDFTEGRLSLKLDPSGGLLETFIALNNQILDRFSPEQRLRIGVHTCPGGDQDATHSAGVDYARLLPALFRLQVGRFFLQLASEKDPARVLGMIRDNLRPHHMVFVGVIDPINPSIESPIEVRDRVLQAAEYFPLSQLGSTDDCGFSPFADDTSTSRDIAFEKIRSRIQGTALAAKELSC